MNKTVDISLAGILFHLEESAYYKLKKYLKSVRNSLQNTDDVDEVMNEIEARIAELLLQKQSNPQQVINEKNIDEIIAIMGQPEDYEEELPAEPNHKTVKKALFRDMDNSVIAGVAAGLAHYLGIDVTLMRLIFIILLFVTSGSFILIYLLLWIVIPKAKTASDKLRMKGEKVDLDNIVEQVSTDEETPKKKVKIGEQIESTSVEIGQVLLKILGFLLVIIAGPVIISLLISAIAILPFAGHEIGFMQPDMFNLIDLPVGWISILSIILIGIPFLLLFILGFKMLFPNSKSFGKNFWLITGTLWVLFLLFFISKTSDIWTQKRETVQIVAVQEKIPLQQDTITLIAKDLIQNNHLNYTKTNQNLKLYYYPTQDSMVQLEVIKKSQGKTTNIAHNNAEKINYPFEIDSINKQVILSKFYAYPSQDFIAEHQVIVKIYVPENKTIKVSDYLKNHARGKCYNATYIQNKENEILCDGKTNNWTDYNENEINENEIITINGEDAQIKITPNGVDIISTDKQDNMARIVIDQNGVNIKAKEQNGDSAVIKINDKGIIIKNTEQNEK